MSANIRKLSVAGAIRSFAELRKASKETEAADDGLTHEQRAVVELNAYQKSARDSLAREKKNMVDRYDSEFWCALYFDSREQKEVFLQAVLSSLKDDKYVDGLALAKALGIALPESPSHSKERRSSPRWLKFVDRSAS